MILCVCPERKPLYPRKKLERLKLGKKSLQSNIEVIWPQTKECQKPLVDGSDNPMKEPGSDRPLTSALWDDFSLLILKTGIENVFL
jgi:hypothetical protein